MSRRYRSSKYPSTNEYGARYVYILVDPRTSQIHYVGMSHCPPERAHNHIVSKSKSELHNQWIDSLKAEGLEPLLVVLEAGTEHQMRAAERQWIEMLARLGAPLTNAQGLPEREQLGLWN